MIFSLGSRAETFGAISLVSCGSFALFLGKLTEGDPNALIIFDLVGDGPSVDPCEAVSSSLCKRKARSARPKRLRLANEFLNSRARDSQGGRRSRR